MASSMAQNCTSVNPNWQYVCLTVKNQQISDDGDCFVLDEINLSPGDCIDMPNVAFSQEAYGPVLVIAWWQDGIC